MFSECRSFSFMTYIYIFSYYPICNVFSFKTHPYHLQWGLLLPQGSYRNHLIILISGPSISYHKSHHYSISSLKSCIVLHLSLEILTDTGWSYIFPSLRLSSPRSWNIINIFFTLQVVNLFSRNILVSVNIQKNIYAEETIPSKIISFFWVRYFISTLFKNLAVLLAFRTFFVNMLIFTLHILIICHCIYI